VELRPARAADAEALAETVALGMEGYRSFAPAGWQPPGVAVELPEVRARLRDPETWCLSAWDGTGAAGHVAFIPARASRRPEGVPAMLAHLWQLFVREPWWGTGLAVTLLARAVEAARERGYEEMRLYTPARHARARRFYEREGWHVAGEPELVPGLGLELVEFRRGLGG
jgi:GNAT superfamily N-acetyltransferase